MSGCVDRHWAVLITRVLPVTRGSNSGVDVPTSQGDISSWSPINKAHVLTRGLNGSGAIRQVDIGLRWNQRVDREGKGWGALYFAVGPQTTHSATN